MPVKPVKLEEGVFTDEDKDRMWQKLREVWRKEKEEKESQE